MLQQAKFFIIIIILCSFGQSSHAQKKTDNLNIKIGTAKVDKTNCLAINYKPTDLLQIDQKWNYHAADYKKLVRSEVKFALVKMLLEAEKAGINIKVVSAYRSYQKQEYLYNRAIKKHGPDQKTTAKPGHSEHQLGTTVDLSTSDPKSVLNQGFGQTKASVWLKKNSVVFGFYQSYTIENSKLTGYIPEPWHYRYLGKDLNRQTNFK